MDYIFFETYFGGVIFIFLGVIKILHTIKKTRKNPDSVLQPYVSGILAGVFIVTAGIAMIIIKIQG